ncbi:mCG64775 [Mus musculus]|nr:mCG64775 [Mus musculus]
MAQSWMHPQIQQPTTGIPFSPFHGGTWNKNTPRACWNTKETFMPMERGAFTNLEWERISQGLCVWGRRL